MAQNLYQDFDLTELHVVENAADGSRVYPCQACGWRLRCAEGCHS